MPRLIPALRALALPVAVLIALTGSGRAKAAPEPKAPPQFVALRDVDPTVIQEIRYITPHNFVGVCRAPGTVGPEPCRRAPRDPVSGAAGRRSVPPP
ncbi:hypothetical protein [Streptomyces sp. HPF1205]|uniref:hypothetical protein n=1 Tax=Streptomyces sp. HPF1205 TaxID=2873262 RepID=UPI0027E033E7|nr:hypothetical protein [Streptomyces sp. HPF1205]